MCGLDLFLLASLTQVVDLLGVGVNFTGILFLLERLDPLALAHL